MDQTQSPQQPAASQPAGEICVAPIGESVNSLSPAQAQARLDELKSDKGFGARLLKTWGKGSSEEHLWNALVDRLAGKQPEQPKAEPTEMERARAGLEPPAEGPEGYKVLDPISGAPMRLDAENAAVVHNELLPAAHALGLSQADINMAAFGILKPMSEADCEAMLIKSWGADADKRWADFELWMGQHPHAIALFSRYREQLFNNAPLIMRIVEAYRARRR